MWEIFLSVDSHDSADRLTVGILHLFHQNVSHFFTHLQFLAPNNPFNEPFLFLLTVGILSQMKWGEGSQLSEVFSSELQRSFILYTREMEMKTCSESSGWLAASFVTTLLMFASNNGLGMFCPIVFSLFRWIHVKSVPQVLSGAITTNGLRWKEWGNLSTTIFSRICLDGGWW